MQKSTISFLWKCSRRTSIDARDNCAELWLDEGWEVVVKILPFLNFIIQNIF